MSKWKDKSITIIQAFQGTHYDGWFGLGDDSKLYQWDRGGGGWTKFWSESDKPE